MINPKNSSLALLCALMPGASALAQFDSQNVELRAWIDLSTFGASNGNSCWGHVSDSGREYALMGLSNKVAFVEISDPDNPVWFASVAHGEDLWADIKVYANHAYIVTEGTSGIQVVDMTNIDNHVVTLVRTIANPWSSHTISIDTTSGILYTCGSGGGNARQTVWSLANPANPVQVGQYDAVYEHESQAVTYTSGPYAGKKIFFGCSEGRGLDIIDMTNPAAPVLMSRTPYPSVAYCHQGWTEDLRYFYINDELDSIQRTTVFDITDLSNPVHLGSFNAGVAATDHNLYVRDGFLFESNYRSGLRIFDTNVDPINPPQVGYFDTYPGSDAAGFQGTWSNYPFFPSGMVIISDIDRGLFIVDPSAALEGSLGFEYPDGQPERVLPAGGTTMRVRVVTASGSAEHQPGTGVLHVDRGSGFEQFPMNSLSDDEYQAVFPESSCGSVIDWYVTAESTTGQMYSDPFNAPGASYSALSAADLIITFQDNFESNLGWTVENINLTDGPWERGIPAGDGSRGDPTADFDGSGRCYVTDNAIGNSDVDGGPTRLISPIFDLTGQTEALVSYARWFSNDDGDIDRLDVHVSNNNGSTWTLVESVADTGPDAWIEHQFRPVDFIPLTSQMKLRFSATDNPNDSVTEAGVDAFSIQTLVCGGTELVGFEVIFGSLVSGGLEQLLESDNDRLRFRSRFGFAVSEPNVAEVRLDFETAQLAAQLMDIAIESRTNVAGASAKVRLRNVNTGSFVLIHTFPVGTTEFVESIDDIAAPNYINQTSGDITMRARYISIVTFSAQGFDAFIDQVTMSVE
jgi:choice-of-anchor B domain-containing protein